MLRINIGIVGWSPKLARFARKPQNIKEGAGLTIYTIMTVDINDF